MSGVDWVLLARNGAKAGDLVSAEAGGMPIYRIIAIEDGEAWLQGEGAEPARRAPLTRFPWKVTTDGASPKN